ncbi:MAG: substrate-binding domain-containing protein [Calditrichia bacterium]
MKNTLKKLAFIFILLPLTFSATKDNNAAEKFIVIVHAENTLETISRKKLSKMFLKKTSRWESQDLIVPVDQKIESPTRIAFTTTIHKKKISSVKAYWQKKIFTGRAIPPVELSSDKEVLNYIVENPGAIGYVSAECKISTHSVKKLAVLYK